MADLCISYQDKKRPCTFMRFPSASSVSVLPSYFSNEMPELHDTVNLFLDSLSDRQEFHSVTTILLQGLKVVKQSAALLV